MELKLELKIEAIPGLSGTNLSLSKIVDKLGLLGRRQLHLVVIQAVPKLRDQCKPFIRGQASDFVMSELHWFRLADPKNMAHHIFRFESELPNVPQAASQVAPVRY